MFTKRNRRDYLIWFLLIAFALSLASCGGTKASGAFGQWCKKRDYTPGVCNR